MFDFQGRRELPAVLVIDDDLVSREVMATVLTMSGYTVHTAADGAAALGLLASGGCVPGVILMDAQMPGLSGTGLIDELRARSRARLYAISGSQAAEEVAAAVDGFLLKPFAANALQELLERDRARGGPSAAEAGRSARAGDAGEPVVNPETLAQLRAMMPEGAVRQIYAAIVADLAGRVGALETAIGKGDAAEVRRIGHAIKGGCGMAGALEAARLGALIEAGAFGLCGTWAGTAGSKDNRLDNSSDILNDLRAATDHLERMLEAEFPR